MDRPAFVKYLVFEGAELDEELSDKQNEVYLSPLSDFNFITLPRALEQLGWFEIVHICDKFNIRVPDECEDFREIYNTFMSWRKERLIRENDKEDG